MLYGTVKIFFLLWNAVHMIDKNNKLHNKREIGNNLNVRIMAFFPKIIDNSLGLHHINTKFINFS